LWSFGRSLQENAGLQGNGDLQIKKIDMLFSTPPGGKELGAIFS